MLLLALALGARFYQDKTDATPINVLPCEDITQGCGNGMFTVKFAEASQVMKPLHLILHLKRAENARSIHVDFAMKNMEMGLNRYRLIQEKQSGDWQAEVTLPVCIQGRSDWNMLIEIDGDVLQRFQVPFSAKANRAS